jgi:hypothetical protein
MELVTLRQQWGQTCAPVTVAKWNGRDTKGIFDSVRNVTVNGALVNIRYGSLNAKT